MAVILMNRLKRRNPSMLRATIKNKGDAHHIIDSRGFQRGEVASLQNTNDSRASQHHEGPHHHSP